MNQVKQKIAVITGVSRLQGIGAAICQELAEAGSRSALSGQHSCNHTIK